MGNKSSNVALHKAAKAKQDEFYTQLSDIENELKHYKAYFKDKIVYCNCDDPYESNFFKYFATSFNALGLKKLITTSYTKSPIAGGLLPLEQVEGLKPDGKEPFKIEINEVRGQATLDDIEWILKSDANVAEPLKNDGDFSGVECVEILKQADIVVTNPPFSLFREYVAQLMDYDKKFLIIGNKNAITYKDVFKFIKEDRLWIGVLPMGTDLLFDVPKDLEQELIATKKEGSAYRIVDGVIKGRSQAVWFTNLEHEKRNDDLVLTKKYSHNEYPKYDNYDAINVDKTKDIPEDYGGVMGVPITFLDKYNPEQFEIVGLGISTSGIEIGVQPYKTEHKKYRKEVQKRGVVNGDLYMVENGIVNVPYARILIRNKRIQKNEN